MPATLKGAGPSVGPPGGGGQEAVIGGYVVDSMEGAVDQAIFLASVDVPIAVIGARGTGKMYIAKIVHEARGGDPQGMLLIDCREFRSREQAFRRICDLLQQAQDKTLVFKSPQLMHPETQHKLARMISSRTFIGARPPRYLPRVCLIALFPDKLERLIATNALDERLASCFAGYPIQVPPLRERGRAVLRWAEKILSQEAGTRSRAVKGFTPEAERAMLAHNWPGNITEVRERVTSALDHGSRQWLTPADLGLSIPLEGDRGMTSLLENFLEVLDSSRAEPEVYVPTAFEEMEQALAEVLRLVVEDDMPWPLGTWLQDELVMAACDRYKNEQPRVAEFLQTPSRNIGRWLPKISERTAVRSANQHWRELARLVREWVRGAPLGGPSPLLKLENTLLSRLQRLDKTVLIRERAEILGVSVPTYQKKVKQLEEQPADSSGLQAKGGSR